MFIGGQVVGMTISDIGIGNVNIHDRHLVFGNRDGIWCGKRRRIVDIGDHNSDYDFIVQFG